ncbi:MAG: recombinase family protein [Flexilinea sp.]|nr:recombinase family protein [Flexilinea sp.]
MNQTGKSDYIELLGPDFNKQARSFQKDKEKELTPEFLKWQNEAAIYLRISSEMQRDGFSIEAQKLECQRYIQSEGYHLSEENIFIDEVHTAKNEDRPAFKEMMVAAHLQRFALLVIHKMDRFERNFANQDKTVKLLKSIGVRVYSLSDGIEISNDLISKLMGILNENYIDNLSYEVAKGKHQKAREGYFIGSKVPFGYRRWIPTDLDADRRQLFVNEKEAAAVNEIFNMYLTGRYSIADLAKYLNDQGFTTYRKRAFSEDTIRSMLENVLYCGFVIYTNHETKSVELYKAKHPAIIPLELFVKMREYRKQKADRYTRRVSNGEQLKNHYLVQALVCCSECGHRLRVRNRTDGSYTYFDCAEESGLQCSKNGKSIVASKLDKIVSDFMKEITLPQRWVDGIAKSAAHEDLTAQIAKKIHGIEEQMKRREYSFIRGISTMSEEEYVREQTVDKNEIAELKKRLPKGSPEINTQVTITNSLIDLFQIATKSEQYDIVHFLFRNLYFDFNERRLSAFEPNPDYEYLFTSFAGDKGWVQKDKIFYITNAGNDEQ